MFVFVKLCLLICFVKLDLTVSVEEQRLQLKDFDIIS